VRICIDARKIGDFGIGTYVRNLLEAYTRVRTGHRFFPIFNPEDAAGFRHPDAFTPCISRSGKYSLNEHWDIPRILRRVKAHLYHSTHYVTPLLNTVPMVVTIHDLIHLIFPQYLPSRAAYAYAKLMLVHSVIKAERVITDSEWSKRDLIRLLHTPEAKIRVIHLAVDERFGKRHRSEWIPVLRHGLKIEDPYVLFVGNFKPHKNVGNLIRAFQHVPEGLCRHLVLTGKGWDRAADLQRLAAETGLTGRILVKEGLSFDEINALYNGAELLVLPSFYEGFGLPPLEAMASGIPVAASRAASIPEICGEAALYFDPDSPREIADAVLRLLNDARLRASFVRKGLKRVGRYSWEKTANETLNVYREVL